MRNMLLGHGHVVAKRALGRQQRPWWPGKPGEALTVRAGLRTQEQQVRRREEGAREGDAHPPAAAEVACPLRLHLLGEAQPVQE